MAFNFFLYVQYREGSPWTLRPAERGTVIGTSVTVGGTSIGTCVSGGILIGAFIRTTVAGTAIGTCLDGTLIMICLSGALIRTLI